MGKGTLKCVLCREGYFYCVLFSKGPLSEVHCIYKLVIHLHVLVLLHVHACTIILLQAIVTKFIIVVVIILLTAIIGMCV